MGYSFSAYFFPNPPREWEMEDIRHANALSQPFYDLAGASEVIGFLGTIFATLGMALRKMRGHMITSKLIYVEITSIALIALGLACYLVGHRHYRGLTEERETELALKEFKQGLEELTVCQSQAELEDKVVNDTSFTSKIAENAIKSADEACGIFAEDYYRPTKDLQPRFRIFRLLTMDQQLDLLDIAYEKGVILHFRNYEQNFMFSDEIPKPLYPKREYSAEIMQKIEDSFACSIKFLMKHLQPLDAQKISFINDQLRALSFKWFNSREEKAFNPRIYLEDDNTVVVRGNFSDSENREQVIWAIESMAPHINTIKVEGIGLLFVLLPEDWDDFKNQLNARFPGKMMFVDKLKDDPSSLPTDIDGIWQKNLPCKPTVLEKTRDELADMDRGKKE